MTSFAPNPLPPNEDSRQGHQQRILTEGAALGDEAWGDNTSLQESLRRRLAPFMGPSSDKFLKAFQEALQGDTSSPTYLSSLLLSLRRLSSSLYSPQEEALRRRFQEATSPLQEWKRAVTAEVRREEQEAHAREVRAFHLQEALKALEASHDPASPLRHEARQRGLEWMATAKAEMLQLELLRERVKEQEEIGAARGLLEPLQTLIKAQESFVAICLEEAAFFYLRGVPRPLREEEARAYQEAFAAVEPTLPSRSADPS